MGFQPQTFPTPYLGSVAYCYSESITLPHNLFYIFLDHSFRFSLPLSLSPIAPHLPPVDASSLSLCARFFHPSLYRSRSNSPPVRRSCLPAATSWLPFPPMPGHPKYLLARSVPTVPLPVVPPCRPQPVPGSLSTPGFSRPRVNSSL